MDSKLPDDEEYDNELVFQNLTPEQPANAFQKSIIRMQDNWPPHWNKRHLLILLTVLSSLLVFFLVFEFMHPSTQQSSTSSSTITTAMVDQVLSYANVIYVVVNPLNNADQLEALNARTGTLVWSYPHQDVIGIKLVNNILYIQTDTNLVALNANTRALLWEHQILGNANYLPTLNLQADQGILFIASTNGTVTALNASTGAQLWATNQPSTFWQVDNGIFYMTSASTSGLGLIALNAHNGQQLWSNMNIYQGSPISNATMNQDLAISNGTVYLQNSKNQNIQAFNGRNGKMLWQFDTHKTDFTLFADSGFLLLSDIKETQAEALNGQTGKLLWQRPGPLMYPAEENPNQTVISSLQKHEIEIIRTSDGTTLYHFPNKGNPNEELISIENGIAFFLYFTQNGSSQYLGSKVIAVRISNGVTIWSSPDGIYIPQNQNNTIDMVVSIKRDSLLSLRADNGHTRWQHTFSITSN